MKPNHRLQAWLAGCSSHPSSTRYSATLAAGFALCAVSSMSAADIEWVGETGSYNIPANWQNGAVPGLFDNAFVNNGGTVQVLPTDPTWWVIDLRAAQGAESSGSYEVSGSRVNLIEWLRIGVEGQGTYTQTAGFLNMLNPSSGRINIGETGQGVLNLSGGVIDQKGGRTTFGERGGENVTSEGTLNQTGGLFNNGGEVWIGQGGTGSEVFGRATVEGGDLVSGNWLSIGRAGGDGELNISGDGTVHKPANAGHMLIGDRAGADGSTGIVNQTGGSLVVGSEFWVGQGGRLIGTDPETTAEIRDHATGTYNMSAGEATFGNWTVVGRDGGIGTLNLSGGTIRKVGANHFIVGAGLGENGTQATGVFNHTSGVFTIEQGELWIGENQSAKGTYNLGGGQLRAGIVALGQTAGATPNATFNLNGGSARVAQIIRRSTAAGAVATVNFNGGLLIPTASRADFIANLTAANIQNGGFNLDTDGHHVGTSQVFTAVGNGGFVKSGLGSFTVNETGQLATSGAVQINRGVVVVDGSLSGASNTIGNGAALAGTGTVIGPTTFAAGSALLSDSLDAFNGDPLAFVGHVTVSGPTRVDFLDTNAAPGTYTVGTYTGTFTGAGNLTLGRPGTVTATGGTITATIQAGRDITWTGSQNSTWDIFTTANWSAGGAVAFGQADRVNFTDAAGTAPISVVGPVRPDLISVNNSAGNAVTLVAGANGSIEGAPLITKDGGGKLIIGLDSPLVAPAGVDLLEGELQIGNGGAAGSLGEALIFGEAGTVVSVNFNTSKTLWNPISGSSSFVKNGSGTVTLAGTTTFDGNTTINGGRLTYLSPALPASPTIQNDAELELSPTAGIVQIGSAISGTGKLIKSGTSEAWLNSASTFTGDVEILRGPNNSLNITHAQALGSPEGKTIVHGLNGNTGQHLNVRQLTGGGNTLAEPLEFHASALGRAGFRHEGADQTLNLTGPISVNSTGLAGVHLWNHVASSTLNISGDITGTMNGAALFLRGSTGPIHVTGSINLDFAELVVTDSARITLGAPGKTYSGFRTNIAFGHLRTVSDNALDPTQQLNLGQNNADQEARLILGSGSTAVQQTLAGITVTNPSPSSGIFGGASVPSTLTLNMNRSTTISTQIGGGGTNENNLNLVKAGPGVLTLSAAVNSYSGTTTVNGGRLVVNGNTSASAYAVNAGGTVGGNGTIGSVVASGTGAAPAAVSPGDTGIGILTAFGTVTLGENSALNVQIGNWTGVAGTGSDLLNVGNLTLTATPENPARIRVSELNLQNFENADRTFRIIQASGNITGFDPSKFVIDATGLPQASGTWDVRQDGNQIVLAFTASVGGGDGFQDWADARGLGPDADPYADPDGDGIANAIEFVIGGEPNPSNPNSNSRTLLPTGSAGANDELVFTFRLSDEAADLDAEHLRVEYSTNLVTWQTATPGVAGVTSSTVDHPTEEGISLVTVTIPSSLAGADGKVFARLAVQIP